MRNAAESVCRRRKSTWRSSSSTSASTARSMACAATSPEIQAALTSARHVPDDQRAIAGLALFRFGLQATALVRISRLVTLLLCHGEVGVRVVCRDTLAAGESQQRTGRRARSCFARVAGISLRQPAVLLGGQLGSAAGFCFHLYHVGRPACAHRSSWGCLDRRRGRACCACPCRRARERPARPGGGEGRERRQDVAPG